MYKAAVIGLGKIGLMYDLISTEGRPGSHSYAYHLHPQIEFEAAVGVRPEQGEHLAKLAPEASFYLDVKEMLNFHKPDIVSICTPSHVRYDLLKDLLERSTAPVIFCEKPVARSIDEAERIRDLMNKHSNRVLIPNHSRRWNAGIAQIRDIIRRETYGKLKKIQIRYTRGIYTSGAHIFDLIRYFADTVDDVRAVAKVPSSLDAQGDWSYSFLFTAGGGIAGHAEAFDDREQYYLFEMDLFFQRGRIEMLQGGDRLRFYDTEEHRLLKGLQTLRYQREEASVLTRSNNMYNAVSHLIDVLEHGTAPVCTLDDGIYPIYVADALIRSWENGGATVPVQFR